MKFLLSTLVILCFYSVNAADITWTNASTDGNWNTAINWSTSTVPGATDIAIFDGTSSTNCSLNSSLNVRGFSIRSGYMGTVTQNLGFTIDIGTDDFIQDAGTFLGGDSDITINGRFILSGGTFTSTSELMTIGENICTNITIFDHQAGTFNHNDGTVEFNPSCTSWSTRTYTIDVLNATTFNHVILDANSSGSGDERLTTAAGDTVQCVGNLTHDDGSVYGLFATEANLTINTEASQGNGWFIFNGTGAQTYTQSSAAARTCGIQINKTAGGVTPVTTTDFSCSQYQQIQGDFTCPVGTMKIGLTNNANITLFDHQDGTFTHNNGTVEFDPSCTNWATRTYIIDVLNATTFNHVIFDANSSGSGDERIAIATNDTLDILGDLLMEDGATTGSWISCEGDVTITSTLTNSSAPLLFKGSNNQNFDLSGATANHNSDLKIDKTAGNVSLLSILNMDAGPGNDLYLIDADLISTATNMLNIGDNVNVFNASNQSFVQGPVRKTGNDSFVFPIGKNDTTYAPISISSPNIVTDHFTAEYFQSNPDLVPYDISLKDVTLYDISICEYWILDRTNGTSDVNVELSWDDRSCDVTDLDNIAVARWDGATWRDHGNSGTTGTLANGTVTTFSAVTSFSPFTLTYSTLNTPLPIELIDFKATKQGKSVLLEWETASEINNSQFEVQQSIDGINFITIDIIAGAGTSSEHLYYSTWHRNPENGINYYRLKQIDFDGEFEYSEIRSVKFTLDNGIVIYPNPVAQNTEITILYPPNNSIRQIKLYDYMGRIIWTNNHPTKTNEPMTLNLPAQEAGSYLIQFEMENDIVIKPLVIL